MAFYLEIVFGLLTMLSFGIADALLKIPLKTTSPRTLAMITQFISSIIFLVLVIVFWNTLTFQLEYIAISIALGLIGYLGFFFFMKAIHVGKVGVVSPITSSAVLVTFMLSIVLLNESLTFEKLSAVVLVVSGIVFMSINFKNFKSSDLFNVSSGIPFAIITFLFWGILWFGFKFPVNALGPLLTGFLYEFGIFLFAFLHSFSLKEKIILEKNVLKYSIVIGVLFVLGTLSYNYGVLVGEVSTVAILGASSSLVTALYGKLFFNEKVNSMQGFGIILAVLGIVILSI